jgi:hypothetical protein
VGSNVALSARDVTRHAAEIQADRSEVLPSISNAEDLNMTRSTLDRFFYTPQTAVMRGNEHVG